MTDNEIIKSMQCVMGNEMNCSECTYQRILPFPSCRNMCAKNALDLINRQNAEIERLLQKLQQAQSKAIKEFAERLKKRFYLSAGRCVVDVYHIDNLVKEMAGDTK